ncbi:MAG: hypothetical protein V2L15_02080, partial [Desulfobacteraceae bacterium]|nr:hypothetical protein [Desulfobacteraceae bacterium]
FTRLGPLAADILGFDVEGKGSHVATISDCDEGAKAALDGDAARVFAASLPAALSDGQQRL